METSETMPKMLQNIIASYKLNLPSSLVQAQKKIGQAFALFSEELNVGSYPRLGQIHLKLSCSKLDSRGLWRCQLKNISQKLYLNTPNLNLKP